MFNVEKTPIEGENVNMDSGVNNALDEKKRFEYPDTYRKPMYGPVGSSNYRSFTFNSGTTFIKRRAITSYGIILFTIVDNEIMYNLCQRRDTISYAEFLKNNLDSDVIRMHINLMSKEERKRCLDYYLLNDPKALWDDLWINHKSRIYKNNMERCCDVFKENMEKYIEEFLDESKGRLENPWGFPKGRKHMHEEELECALREFEEETTIPSSTIQVLNFKPFEELYLGTDNQWYRTVYYVAYIPYIPKVQDKESPEGIRKTFVSEEVSKMGWFNYKKCFDKIDEQKKKLLCYLNKKLLFTRKRKPLRRHTA